MFENGFWNRFAKRGTLKQIFLSTDWVVSAVLIVVLYCIFGDGLMNYNMDSYIKSATSLSRSLIAITLSGVAIIVALTDKNVLATLNRIDAYDELMVVFELTVFLSIFTTLYGIVLQVYPHGFIEIYGFTFFFAYMILNVFRLVSDIVTFGEKISQVVMIENLPDDISEIVKNVSDSDDEDPNDPSDQAEAEADDE